MGAVFNVLKFTTDARVSPTRVVRCHAHLDQANARCQPGPHDHWTTLRAAMVGRDDLPQARGTLVGEQRDASLRTIVENDQGSLGLDHAGSVLRSAP
ncbi:MAG: hypothetical protein ACI8UD_000743 [Planctomycetota bacterium]